MITLKEERTEYILHKEGKVLISSSNIETVKSMQFLRGGQISKIRMEYKRKVEEW